MIGIYKSEIDFSNALEVCGKSLIDVSYNEFDVILSGKLKRDCSDVGNRRCSFEGGDSRLFVVSQIECIDAKRGPKFDDRP